MKLLQGPNPQKRLPPKQHQQDDALLHHLTGRDLIWSTITSEREETMAMKNPPHPGRGIRENCLEPLGLSPNPPKDTDGRREESGRGGEGATGEIAWVPFGVGRSADGLHRRTGAPMAVCGSCDARDGERIRSRGLSRPGWHESAGIFGCPVGGSVADGAVRPGVEWLAAGPRRG